MHRIAIICQGLSRLGERYLFKPSQSTGCPKAEKVKSMEKMSVELQQQFALQRQELGDLRLDKPLAQVLQLTVQYQ